MKIDSSWADFFFPVLAVGLLIFVALASCGRPKASEFIAGVHCKVELTIPDVRAGQKVLVDAHIVSCTDGAGRLVMPDATQGQE